MPSTPSQPNLDFLTTTNTVIILLLALVFSAVTLPATAAVFEQQAGGKIVQVSSSANIEKRATSKTKFEFGQVPPAPRRPSSSASHPPISKGNAHHKKAALPQSSLVDMGATLPLDFSTAPAVTKSVALALTPSSTDEATVGADQETFKVARLNSKQLKKYKLPKPRKMGTRFSKRQQAMRKLAIKVAKSLRVRLVSVKRNSTVPHSSPFSPQ